MKYQIKFRPSVEEEREGNLYYQLSHNGVTRRINTDMHLFPTEWDKDNSRIILSNSERRNELLYNYIDRINCELRRLEKIIRKFSSFGSFLCIDVVEEFKRFEREYSIFNYFEIIIQSLKKRGKLGTASSYSSALKSVKSFMNNEDIPIDRMNALFIENYEVFLYSRNVVANTVSFYMRILRALYNRAIEEDIVAPGNPFRKVYTGVDKTVKRALPAWQIRRIRTLDLTRSPHLDYARDIFMLSFYLRGMSFIDMAYLKKNSLKDGFICYSRQKTGRNLMIEWTKEMQDILNKYGDNATEYLFPILKSREDSERERCRQIYRKINRNMKKLAVELGLNMKLTSYVARHSWASIAHANGIPIPVISAGLGHDSERTTKIYLRALDRSEVDKANERVIREVMGK